MNNDSRDARANRDRFTCAVVGGLAGMHAARDAWKRIGPLNWLHA